MVERRLTRPLSSLYVNTVQHYSWNRVCLGTTVLAHSGWRNYGYSFVRYALRRGRSPRHVGRSH